MNTQSQIENMMNNFNQIDKVKLYDVESFIHGDLQSVHARIKELNAKLGKNVFDYFEHPPIPSLDGEENNLDEPLYCIYGVVTGREINDLDLDQDFLINDYEVKFIPQVEDYCLMIDGKSDGYVYHYTTIVDMINDGFTWKSNEKFKRMTRMTSEELQYFLDNRKY